MFLGFYEKKRLYKTVVGESSDIPRKHNEINRDILDKEIYLISGQEVPTPKIIYTIEGKKATREGIAENVYTTCRIKKERTPNTSLRKHLFKHLPSEHSKKLKEIYGENYVQVYSWQCVGVGGEEWYDCWIEVKHS